MFNKILVANRGEIACRVFLTARRMGIRTVAVFSEADRNARHVAAADESIFIGAGPARESYLDIDHIINACRKSGADALHPGYGFLSEDALFAQRVEEAGIVFIGPKHRSIELMADKISARAIAAKAGVQIVPGHDSPIEDCESAIGIADSIGYPVMIKASAGGGGRGLRVAIDAAGVRDNFDACRREALNSFGNDSVFIERFVEYARHVEIQVLCDAYGNRVSLGERECSIQRRHQKIIEEAPSPFIDAAIRVRMSEQALALAAAVDYQSAGTVEFVVGRDKRFYFLEFNTRLQVEHPVTECVTGIDLVEQMIRIAAGEQLSFSQQDVRTTGWSIECRINAEDPSRGFLPSSGRLVRYRPPKATFDAAGRVPDGGGLRLDTGVTEGSEVPIFYDSMIGKLIVHGADRHDAIRRMRDAVNAFVVRGVMTNLEFLGAILAHPRFVSGDVSTSMIGELFADGFHGSLDAHADPAFIAALATAAHGRGSNPLHNGIHAEVNGHDDAQTWSVILSDEHDLHRSIPVTMRRFGSVFDVEVDLRSYAISLNGGLREIAVHGECGGRPFVAQVEKVGLGYRIAHDGAQVHARVLSRRAAHLHGLMPKAVVRDGALYLRSPMPGLLVDLAVRAGQKVRKGERLATVEAMKMENVLVSQRDGIVAEVVVKTGDSLSVDQIILRFD